MNTQSNVKIVLDAVNNASKQLEEVSKSITDVGNTADQTTQKTGLLGGAFSNLGGLIAGMAGTAGMKYMIDQATDSDKSLVRLQLSLGRYSDSLKDQLLPQVLNAGKGIENMGLSSDELASETIGRLLPTFKNDLPRAINGASTLLTLMKYDVRGASTVLNFLGEDSDFAQIAMKKLAKAVGIDVNPKMDDLGEMLQRVSDRLKKITLPPFVQELGQLMGHLETLAENVGAKMLAIINPLLAGVNMLFAIPVVGHIAEWATAFGTVALMVGGVLKFFGLMPAVMAVVTGAWGLLSTGVVAFGIAMGIGTMGGAVGALVAVIAGLALLGVAIYKAITDWDGFKTMVSNVWTAIVNFTKTAWETIVQTVKNSAKWVVDGIAWLGDRSIYLAGYMVGSIVKFFIKDLPDGIGWFATTFLPQFIGTIAQWFVQLPTMIGNALASLPSIFATIFNNVRTIISGVLGDIMNWVKDLPNKLLDNIRTGINWVIDKINTFANGYNSAMPKGMAITPIPRLATGGIVTRPTTALIGEAGAEAVIPLSRLGAMGGGANITFDFSGSTLLSEGVAVQIMDMVVDRLRKQMRIPSRSF